MSSILAPHFSGISMKTFQTLVVPAIDGHQLGLMADEGPEGELDVFLGKGSQMAFVRDANGEKSPLRARIKSGFWARLFHKRTVFRQFADQMNPGDQLILAGGDARQKTIASIPTAD